MHHIVLLLLMCNVLLAYAENTVTNKKQSLTQLRQHIDSLQQTLSEKEQQRVALLLALKAIEKKISQCDRRLHTLQPEITEQLNKLNKLKQQAKKYKNDIAHHKQSLEEYLKAAYRLGSRPYLPLLFSPALPQETSRLIRYYSYYAKSQVLLLEKLKTTLAALKQTEMVIRQENMTLTAMYEMQKSEQVELEIEKINQKKLLKTLNNSIQNKQQQLTRLQRDEQKLSSTVLAISKLSHEAVGTVPFEQVKGSLPWPTMGRVVSRYGQAYEDNLPTRNGLLIQANEGQAVHAVYDGVIVFAEWLRGFGLMLIIEHGNGYMSLYGRNHSLYKQVGSLVKSGELIASVGESGGYVTPGLYFEIRHNGRPVDPSQWLIQS